MADIKTIGPKAYNAEITLREITERSKHGKMKAVIVIILNEDGTQEIETSYMNHYEKCFLKCFFDSWILGWFSDMRTK